MPALGDERGVEAIGTVTQRLCRRGAVRRFDFNLCVVDRRIADVSIDVEQQRGALDHSDKLNIVEWASPRGDTLAGAAGASGPWSWPSCARTEGIVKIMTSIAATSAHVIVRNMERNILRR